MPFKRFIVPLLGLYSLEFPYGLLVGVILLTLGTLCWLICCICFCCKKMRAGNSGAFHFLALCGTFGAVWTCCLYLLLLLLQNVESCQIRRRRRFRETEKREQSVDGSFQVFHNLSLETQKANGSFQVFHNLTQKANGSLFQNGSKANPLCPGSRGEPRL